MILEVKLTTPEGDMSIYASPEDLENGVDVAKQFPEKYKELVGETTFAVSDDGDSVVVTDQSGTRELAIDEYAELPLAHADGCKATACLIPYLMPCEDDDEMAILSEWDDVAAEPVYYRIPVKDLIASDEDPEAALRVAEAVEEQQPELLEIIADYMANAAHLGSADAKAWLADYYEESDQKYHPYA